MWFLLLWGIGLVVSLVYFLVSGFPKDIREVSHILLLHQFVVTFGLVGIIGFIENVVVGEKAAKMVGWSSSPYQVKYGFSQLCLGIMGVLAIWFQGTYWIGVLINMYMYSLSGFWTHTGEMIKHKKLDPIHMANHVMNLLYQIFITVLSVFAGVWSH